MYFKRFKIGIMKISHHILHFSSSNRIWRYFTFENKRRR
jgi:hypothetical protein